MTSSKEYEYPLTPFLIYDLHNPPFIPMVQTLLCIQPVVPLVSALIANEATEKAHLNPARMVFYNRASDNFWDSAMFSAAVQTAVDLLALEIINERLRSPELGAKDAVQQAVGFLVSELLIQSRELRSVVSPETMHAAEQNVKLFQNRKQEILSMHSDFRDSRIVSPHQMVHGHAVAPYGGHPMPHQGHMVPAHMVPQMHSNYPPAHYPMHHSGYPPVAHHQQPSQFTEQFQPGFGAPRQHAASFSNGGRNFSRYPSENVQNNIQHVGGSRFERFQDIRQTDEFEQQRDVSYRHTSGAFAEPPIKREETKASQPAKTELPILTVRKGSEMDRSKHTITFIGESYSPDIRLRSNEFIEATQSLRDTVVREGVENIFVDENVYVEPNVESAVACGLSKRMDRQGNNDGKVSVFRCFIAVTKPLLCIEDVSDYMKNFRETSNFSMLAIRMKAVASALEAKKETEKTYTTNVISFLNQLDKMFTAMVNQFLKYDLNTSVTIESFAEDVTSLGDYLFNKYGTEYSAAFKQFEGQALDIVLNTYDAEIEEEIGKRVIVHSDLHMELIPLNHSLTYVGLNEAELGYEVTDTPCIIDPEITPSLFAIADSIASHSKQIGFNTLSDLLVTADGTVYKLYQSAIKNRTYMIGKL